MSATNNLRRKNLGDDFIYYLFLWVFIYPPSFGYIPSHLARQIIYLGAIASSFLYLCVYFIEYKISKFVLLIIAYCIPMTLTTFINGAMWDVVRIMLITQEFPIVRMIGMCAFVTYMMRKNPRRCCNILFAYLLTLISLNFLTIILFPGGMYVSGQEGNYLLGLDNAHSVFYYFALGVAFMRDRINSANTKISLATLLLIIIINLSVIICMSATSLVQLFIFDLMLCLRKKLARFRFINFKTAIFINIAFTLFLLFIFTSIGNDMIVYIAENFLHKDATFTARTFIWEDSVYHILRQPWLGYGWNAEQASMRIGAYHSHNQYLTDLYYGGLPMLMILLSIILSTAIKMDKYKKDSIYPFLLSVFFASIFHWHTESFHIPMQLVTFCMIYNIDCICGCPRVKAKYTLRTCNNHVLTP